VDDARMRLHDSMEDCVANAQRRLDAAGRSLALLSPAHQIARARARYEELQGRLVRIAPQIAMRSRTRMQPLAAQLNALSPLAILGRGYALARTWPDGELLKSADQVSPGSEIQVSLGKGNIIAAVERIEE
jgi:exodeoxyribonuclease VII large subunit